MKQQPTLKEDKTMASSEFITKRIEGKQKEISKLEKRLERIMKAKASNWEDNPYCYSEWDERSTVNTLEEAKGVLEKYQADLVKETEKDNSRNVEAIIKFLDMWANKVFNWYDTVFANYQIARVEYDKKRNEYSEWLNNFGTWKDPNAEQIMKEWNEYKKAFNKKWMVIFPYINRKKFDSEKLKKELEQEKKAKYDDIVNRANKICGTITDATGLYVGEKGELNGLVIGDRGRAYIETIGAGGYNIQCFHFRTLIHERK